MVMVLTAGSHVQFTQSAQKAKAASQLPENPNSVPTHPLRLDKNHRLTVNLFDDIDKSTRVSETYTPPEAKEFKPMVRMSAC